MNMIVNNESRLLDQDNRFANEIRIKLRISTYKPYMDDEDYMKIGAF